jgi:hypothetical protein
MIMNRLTKISLAVICALGVSAVTAQTVQRDGQEVKPAQTRAPVKTAQAGGAAAGGAAGGTAAAAGAGTAAAVFAVGVGLAAVAGASQSADSATTHAP